MALWIDLDPKEGMGLGCLCEFVASEMELVTMETQTILLTS